MQLKSLQRKCQWNCNPKCPENCNKAIEELTTQNAKWSVAVRLKSLHLKGQIDVNKAKENLQPKGKWHFNKAVE